MPVTEWWPIRLDEETYNSINQAGRTLTKALRHPDDWWCAPRDESVSAVTAVNVLILRNKVPRGTVPKEPYTYCKLWWKDRERPRYHLLVRDPSRDERFIPGMIPGV